MTHDPSWMGPQVTIAAAQTSRELRRQRDVELAAWCGLDAGETAAFLERLAEFDDASRAERQRRRREMYEVETDELAHARLRRDLTAYWMRDELEEAA